MGFSASKVFMYNDTSFRQGPTAYPQPHRFQPKEDWNTHLPSMALVKPNFADKDWLGLCIPQTTYNSRRSNQIIIVNGLAYVTVSLSFGSKPAPVVYSTTSDGLFDLANDILR